MKWVAHITNFNFGKNPKISLNLGIIKRSGDGPLKKKT